MEKKVVTTLIGLALGWIVSQIATEILEGAGVPKHTATVAGGVIGALV